MLSLLDHFRLVERYISADNADATFKRHAATYDIGNWDDADADATLSQNSASLL